MDDVKKLIDDCLTNPQYADGRLAVKAETWEHFGEGAKHVADYLISKYEALTDTKEGEA